jgi:hypothetical protein
VDHDGALLRVLLVDVMQVEPVGQVVIELHRGALPLAADGVQDLDINLRPSV